MYREGYGVYVIPIWGFQTHYEDTGEEIPDPEAYEPSHVSDIEVGVVKLDLWHEYRIGGAICAKIGDNFYVPMDNFLALDDLSVGDTHDLRDRWFANKAEAEEYAAYVENRWRNPCPWESFVQL